MPEAQTKANNASSRGGNKQGAFKDKDKPTEIRMSNITAAKGEEGTLIQKVSITCGISDIWNDK